MASAEEYGAIWLEELQRMLGPDVAVDAERDSWWWIQVPHFIFSRFYCYSYAFGKMLTLALYDLWKERGDAFVADYHALLGAGGSRPPAELFAADGGGADPAPRWRTTIGALRGVRAAAETGGGAGDAAALVELLPLRAHSYEDPSAGGCFRSVGCWASARHCPALPGGMPVVCRRYAGGMPTVCRRYAGG